MDLENEKDHDKDKEKENNFDFGLIEENPCLSPVQVDLSLFSICRDEV